MDNIYVKIFEIIITLFFGILLPFGIKLIKAKIDIEKYNYILGIIKKAVEAAQQVIGKDNCEEKKKEVMNYVVNVISNYKINLTVEDVDKLVEAAVYEMKNIK